VSVMSSGREVSRYAVPIGPPILRPGVETALITVCPRSLPSWLRLARSRAPVGFWSPTGPRMNWANTPVRSSIQDTASPG
jgi:hypothetical protein